jgi:putative membrane protein
MIGNESLWTLCLAGMHHVTPHNLWQSWSLAPSVLIPLGLVLIAGLRGHALDAARLPGSAHVAHRRWFVAGWLLLVAALLSPLCRLSATLVSAHMVQLMLLAGPGTALLALGRTGTALTLVLDREPSGRHAARAPALAPLTLAYGAAIWLWHAPPLYAAILSSPLWHWLAFAGLIGVSTAFWAGIVAACRHRAGGPALVALLTTLMHTGLLGALLTFAPRTLYPVEAAAAAAWSLTTLQDQQLAGLIMWVAGGIFYLLAASAGCAFWLRTLNAADAALHRA